MKILVTGGASFIGSHTCLALLEADHSFVVFDDLSNSRKSVLDRIQKANKDFLSRNLRDTRLIPA